MSSLSGLVLFFFSLSRLVSESFQERTFDFASLCWFCVLGILFCQCFFLSCVFFAPEDCLKNSPFVRSFFFSPPRLVSENFRERTFDFEALCLFCVWVYCFANVFALLRTVVLSVVSWCVCVSAFGSVAFIGSAVVCLLEAEGGLRWSFACLRLKGVREAARAQNTQSEFRQVTLTLLKFPGN